jgi:hypothetical protein
LPWWHQDCVGWSTKQEIWPKKLVRMSTRTTNPAAPRMMPLPLINHAIGSVGCMFGLPNVPKGVSLLIKSDLICHVFWIWLELPCFCKGRRVSSRLWTKLQSCRSEKRLQIQQRMQSLCTSM